jgi:hypothetical protein
MDPAHLITELLQHMTRVGLVCAARHASPATFVHSDLEKCTHVFLCQDTSRRALKLPPPYSGSYQVLSRRDKTLQPRVRERPVTMSADGVKLAYIIKGTDRGNNFNPPAPATPAIVPPATCPSPPQELRVPVATSIFPLASTCEQPFFWGGGWCGNVKYYNTDNLHIVAKAANIYTSHRAA